MALLRTPEATELQLTPLLQERWSPRAFDAEHTLADGQLELLLEAARWAPSAGNSQPWGFIVGRRRDDTHTRFFQHLSRGNTAWVGRASAVIVTVHQIATDTELEFKYSDYAAYDLGQAAAHLTVQAHALGLHVHQFAGFDHEATQAEFGVPPHWKVTTGIAIGQLAPPESLEDALASRETAPRTRRPLSEVAFAGQWGEAIRLR
jgi:nitroreductase